MSRNWRNYAKIYIFIYINDGNSICSRVIDVMKAFDGSKSSKTVNVPQLPQIRYILFLYISIVDDN